MGFALKTLRAIYTWKSKIHLSLDRIMDHIKLCDDNTGLTFCLELIVINDIIRNT